MPDLPSMPASEHAGESRTDTLWIRNITYGAGDARNWMRRVISRIQPSAGRGAILTTDHSLHSGNAPDRIPRTTSSGSGLIGPAVNAFPYNGDFAYIPHLPVVRDSGTARPLRTYDDGAYIPGTPAGELPK